MLDDECHFDGHLSAVWIQAADLVDRHCLIADGGFQVRDEVGDAFGWRRDERSVSWTFTGSDPNSLNVLYES